jgi:hypothetical protein
VARPVRRKVTRERMATDLSKYCKVLHRLRLENPKLERVMLEHYLRSTYRDELEKLNPKPSDIYDGCLAEERSISETPSRSEPRQPLGERAGSDLDWRRDPRVFSGRHLSDAVTRSGRQIVQVQNESQGPNANCCDESQDDRSHIHIAPCRVHRIAPALVCHTLLTV